MSVEYTIGKKEEKINETGSIRIETKTEDGYFWDEVSYKDGKLDKFIGTYIPYDYPTGHEWLEYDCNYIVIFKKITFSHHPAKIIIDTLFDVKQQKLIKGTNEELFEYYNNLKSKGITRTLKK